MPAEDTDQPLDPEGRYGAEDLLVSARRDLPGREGAARGGGRLPAREVVYQVLRQEGPMSLAALTRELAVIEPLSGRGAYDEEPELFVLRLVVGERLGLPALAPLGDMVRALAADPRPDPDYGFEVRPA